MDKFKLTPLLAVKEPWYFDRAFVMDNNGLQVVLYYV